MVHADRFFIQACDEYRKHVLLPFAAPFPFFGLSRLIFCFFKDAVPVGGGAALKALRQLMPLSSFILNWDRQKGRPSDMRAVAFLVCTCGQQDCSRWKLVMTALQQDRKLLVHAGQKGFLLCHFFCKRGEVFHEKAPFIFEWVAFPTWCPARL